MWATWREATERALYGAGGFYRTTRPERHFRTSVQASSRFAAAIAAILADLHIALGQPVCLDVVDLGAGSGRLLMDLGDLSPVPLRRIAVDLAPRPDELPPEIEWRPEPPATITGLVIANEWLDNVPVDVVELTADGPRLVLVDPGSGAERLGDPPPPEDLAWLSRWWPLEEPGNRAEIGRPRDEAWARVTGRIDRGLAIAADYHHLVGDRPPFGTLTGYRDGRQVTPVPDGSCDITAHVALDACAVSATWTLLTTQREALRALGIRGETPPIELAGSDPRGYLRALQEAGAEAELIDRNGFGGFGWLVQSFAATMGRW